MELSIAERQALVAKIEKQNNINRALIADRFAISKNLNKLFVNGICTNAKQYSIIVSLIEFNASGREFTDKQLALASSIILQNASYFGKTPRSEADDSDAGNADPNFPLPE